MLAVVIHRVDAEVAGEAAGENLLEMLERAGELAVRSIRPCLTHERVHGRMNRIR